MIIKSGIYKITCLINNKIYIGSSININKRINEHKLSLINNNHANKHLQNAWNKYSQDNFIFEIIELVENTKLLIEREQYYLNILQPFNNNGYNICVNAGNTLGRKASEETKKLWSSQRKGKKIGSDNGMWGKKRPDLVERNKLGRGRKLSEEVKLKMRANPKVIKPVLQYDLNDNIVNEYPSITEASKQNNVNIPNIVEVCRGNRKTAGGYKWKYKNIID